jgi:hypothetical protein
MTICISFHVRRINMYMSLNGKEHMYISIRLDDIRCFKGTKLDCAEILAFPRIWKCLYLCIAVLDALCFLLSRTCMLVFPKQECLYTCMAESHNLKVICCR